jgi:hypothetical protein
MPTTQEQQIDHASFPWYVQLDRSHKELQAQGAEIWLTAFSGCRIASLSVSPSDSS